MSLRERLKKLSKHPGIVASAALIGTLVTGKIATHQNATNESDLPSQSEVSNHEFLNTSSYEYFGPEFDQKIERIFDISGTESDLQATKHALFRISNTPEGKKLLDDLNSFDNKVKISFPDPSFFGKGVGGQTDPESSDLEVFLNRNFLSNRTETTLILFHELCHVRQKQDGAGCVNDFSIERFDHHFAREAEARLMTSMMSLYLSEKQNGLAYKESALDAQVYLAVKKGLTSQNPQFSEEQIDKMAKETILSSFLSGKSTDLVNSFISSQQKEQFEESCSHWFLSYAVEAGKEAISSPINPIFVKYPGSANNSMLKMAQRLGVDKESLLPSNGYNLADIQKDKFGNIISGSIVYRETGEIEENFVRTYDTKNRLTSMTEYKSGKLSKKLEYEYENGPFPLKLIETKPQYGQTTVNYDAEGKRLSEISNSEVGETTTLYKDDKKQKEVHKHKYGTTEIFYDQNEKMTDQIIKTNDGTVIDEFHKNSTSSQNIPLNVIQSQKGMSH